MRGKVRGERCDIGHSGGGVAAPPPARNTIAPMCGRFSLIASPEEARALFGYLDEEWFPPRYNIAPTQPVAAVFWAQGRRRMRLMRWGLVPGWVKEPRKFALLINARAEELAEKPSFKNAFRHRRCLVPASGFYEWQRLSEKRKQPYFLRPKEGGLFAFAGLWETWLGADGSEIDTLAIVTTEASEDIAGIHHRVPVVVAPEDHDRWLKTGEYTPAEAGELLARPKPGFFEPVAVADLVNAVKNEGPDLVKPAPPAEPEPPLDDLPLFGGMQRRA